jgi:hypothetical protein
MIKLNKIINKRLFKSAIKFNNLIKRFTKRSINRLPSCFRYSTTINGDTDYRKILVCFSELEARYNLKIKSFPIAGILGDQSAGKS